MARAAKARGRIGAQGEVTRGRSKWSTEKCNMSYNKSGQLRSVTWHITKVVS